MERKSELAGKISATNFLVQKHCFEGPIKKQSEAGGGK